MQQGFRQFFRDAGPALLLMDRRTSGWRPSPDKFRRWLAGLAALGLLAGLLLWTRNLTDINAMKIRDLRVEYERVEAEHRRLQAEWDAAHSLAGVQAVAEQRLGMVKVNHNQVIHLQPPEGPGVVARAANLWRGLSERLSPGEKGSRP